MKPNLSVLLGTIAFGVAFVVVLYMLTASTIEQASNLYYKFTASTIEQASNHDAKEALQNMSYFKDQNGNCYAYLPNTPKFSWIPCELTK